MRPKTPGPVILFLILLGGICAYVGGGGIVQTGALLWQGHEVKSWAGVPGHLESCRAGLSGTDHTRYVINLRYSYTVAGKLHQGHRYSLAGPDRESFSEVEADRIVALLETRGELQVWYDPAQPSRSALSVDTDVYVPQFFGALLFGTVGFGLLSGLLAEWLTRRRRRTRTGRTYPQLLWLPFIFGFLFVLMGSTLGAFMWRGGVRPPVSLAPFVFVVVGLYFMLRQFRPFLDRLHFLGSRLEIDRAPLRPYETGAWRILGARFRNPEFQLVLRSDTWDQMSPTGHDVQFGDLTAAREGDIWSGTLTIADGESELGDTGNELRLWCIRVTDGPREARFTIPAAWTHRSTSPASEGDSHEV